jgi:hypothetical protein
MIAICSIVLSGAVMGGDITINTDRLFDLPEYQKIAVNGVPVFKSCKEVSANHPLRYLFSGDGPIYQLEFTDEYLSLKKSSEMETAPIQINLLWPPSGTYGEEWNDQNADTSVDIVGGLYSGYQCEMRMQHWYNPTNRVSIPYWQYNSQYFRYEKKYLPKNYWIDQWFYWTDSYLLDGDQSGYFTQQNAFRLDQNCDGKGCWDHVVNKTLSIYNGNYFFDKFWPHLNIDDHADWQFALPAHYNPWPDYVYNFNEEDPPLVLRYWIHNYGEE